MLSGSAAPLLAVTTASSQSAVRGPLKRTHARSHRNGRQQKQHARQHRAQNETSLRFRVSAVGVSLACSRCSAHRESVKSVRRSLATEFPFPPHFEIRFPPRQETYVFRDVHVQRRVRPPFPVSPPPYKSSSPNTCTSIGIDAFSRANVIR